jgi:hypothetical protein
MKFQRSIAPIGVIHVVAVIAILAVVLWPVIAGFF